MRLDIRVPIGAMFLILGAIITVFGFASDKRIYAVHSLGININAWWGMVLLLFGMIMLGLAWRHRLQSQPTSSRPHPPGPSPRDQKTT
jgi:predicted CDP-diglyceride synthetase/phosphatidate cytidylyltransferase